MGSAEQIFRLARHCGLTFERDGASYTHNLRTAVIDARGRLQKILTGNEWTAEELSNELRRGAQPEGGAGKSER